LCTLGAKFTYREKLHFGTRNRCPDDPTALEQLSSKGSVKRGDEFVVEAEMEGASAGELNRTFLSALRKVEKRTTVRAEWTSDDTSERFFDSVLKKTTNRIYGLAIDPITVPYLIPRPATQPTMASLVLRG
jgi:hypothetical protein